MRSTVKERYTQALDEALGQLRAIWRGFEGSADLYGTLGELKLWRDRVIGVIENYEGGRHPEVFRELVDLDPPAMSEVEFENACTTCDYNLRRIISAIPELHIVRGYDDDFREQLERLDQLIDQLNDVDHRSAKGHGARNYATARDGLDRWKQHAHQIIKELVSNDEASRFYQKRAGNSWGDQDGSIDDQLAMYHNYLHDLKDEIQKYPDRMLQPPKPTPSRVPTRLGLGADYVHQSRIAELQKLTSSTYDTTRLVRLCEELNICWHEGADHAVAMLVRSIVDHIPPVFRVTSFGHVASNYAGSKSFKEAAAALEVSARKIADAHLHTPIRRKETLPTSTQVDFSALLDVVLQETVRLLKP